MASMITLGSRNVQINGRFIKIARLDADRYLFLDDPEAFVNELRQVQPRLDLFTFLQRLPETAPKFKYPMELDNLAVLPITTFDEWWNKQLGFKGRNKAKQAGKKGVVLREVPFDDALVHGIWEIYNECPVRQGRPFSHFGKDLETVRRESATYLEHSIFMGAFLEDQLIGFIKMTADETRTQANLMNIVSMIRHRDKAPTNALVAEAVRACANRGIPNLVYSNFAYGRRQTDSVSDFKERNGFFRVDLPRYYVPLTPLGRMALSCGLHRPLIYYVPESLLFKVRELRNSWYIRKMHSNAEAS